MKFTTDKIEALAEKLREMPHVDKSKQEHSKQEVVKILYKEITELQKRGYTLKQISEMLNGDGFSISTPTLKSYLQRAKPVHKKTVKKVKELPQTNQDLNIQLNTEKTSFNPKPDSDDI